MLSSLLLVCMLVSNGFVTVLKPLASIRPQVNVPLDVETTFTQNLPARPFLTKIWFKFEDCHFILHLKGGGGSLWGMSVSIKQQFTNVGLNKMSHGQHLHS